MKWKVFVPLFFLFSSIIWAHVDINSFGLKLGINEAKFSVDSPYITSDDFNYNSHLNLGLFISFDMGKSFNLNTGISYYSQGAKLIIYNATAYYNLFYIYFPMELQFVFNRNNIRPFFSFGTQFSFLINTDEKTISQNIWWGEDSTIISHDKVNWAEKLDIDINASMGIKFLFNKLLVILEFKTIYGVFDINSNDNEKYRNLSFLFDIGFGLYNGIIVF